MLETLCQLSYFNIQGHIGISLKCAMQFETKKKLDIKQNRIYENSINSSLPG